MEEGIASTFASTASRTSFLKWFADLNKVMLHPGLREEDKMIWMWLATRCTSDLPCSYVTSYAHISLCLDKRPRLVQDCLLRLLSTGFLIADLPVHFDEPTLDMIQKVREVRIKTPYLIARPKKEEDDLAFAQVKKEAILLAAALQEKKQKEAQKEEPQKAEPEPKPLSLMQRVRRFILFWF